MHSKKILPYTQPNRKKTIFLDHLPCSTGRQTWVPETLACLKIMQKSHKDFCISSWINGPFQFSAFFWELDECTKKCREASELQIARYSRGEDLTKALSIVVGGAAVDMPDWNNATLWTADIYNSVERKLYFATIWSQDHVQGVILSLCHFVLFFCSAQ